MPDGPPHFPTTPKTTFVALVAGLVAVLMPILMREHAWALPLAFGAGAAGCLAAALRVGGRTANLLVASASLALAGVLLVGIAQVLRKDIQLQGESDLIARGGPLGWTLRPGAHRVIKTLNGHTVYDVVYTIDANGRRVTRSTADAPAVAFLGDSFTFGEGVSDADTLPQSFANITGSHVVNLGVSAYSPAQVLRELDLGRDDDVLEGVGTVFMLTAPWHIDRVACLDDFVVGAPRYVLRDGRLIDDGQCPGPHRGRLEELWRQTPIYAAFFAGRLPFISKQDIETFVAVVVEAGRVARSRYGVTLKVLYLRHPGYLRWSGASDDDIIRRVRAGGVDVFEMLLPYEGKPGFAILGDGHPNGTANRLRARMLVDALRAQDVGNPSSRTGETAPRL